MQIGQKLKAIDVCKMEITNIETLVIGKEYTVIDIRESTNDLIILDEENDWHLFNISTYTDFFEKID